MGLFGGGSSSKSSTSQGQSGSQTQLGDPVSINVSGNKKGQQAIHVVRTDFGTVKRSFALADKVLDVNDSVLAVAKNFALDTVSNARQISSEIIKAGQNSAGATERIAGALESFVSKQNNPDEKNQMWLIASVVGVLALIVVKRK